MAERRSLATLRALIVGHPRTVGLAGAAVLLAALLTGLATRGGEEPLRFVAPTPGASTPSVDGGSGSATEPPGDAVGEQPTDGVRPVALPPGLYPDGHDAASWLTLHPGADLATCTVCHAPSTCSDCHGTELPHPQIWAATHGKAALSEQIDCTTCHADTTQDCTTCHGLEMPHDDNWVTAHRAVARPDPAACATCHLDEEGGPSDCASCHQLDDRSSCTTCHADNVEAIARAAGHEPDQCLTCHEQDPGVPGPGVGHQIEPQCLSCHDGGELRKDGELLAARNWLRGVGQGYGDWTKRLQHSPTDLASCASCHDVHDAAQRSFPPGVTPTQQDCASTCHTATLGDVEVYGFLNASGDPEQTVYRGPINPGVLLANTTTAHGDLYAENGCAGLCHSGPHGEVTECKECHPFEPAVEAEVNLHSTHASLVGAEASQADPEHGEGTACQYCHYSEGGDDLARDSCWNCHLSGHDPQTPYWELPS